MQIDTHQITLEAKRETKALLLRRFIYRMLSLGLPPSDRDRYKHPDDDSLTKIA